jgi:hypothetical protein
MIDGDAIIKAADEAGICIVGRTVKPRNDDSTKPRNHESTKPRNHET